MEINIDSRGTIQIVKISGKLDGTTSPQAQDKIIPLLTEKCSMVFDLSGCKMISSAGLRILLMFAKQIKKQRGEGVIAGLSEEVKEVMEMTGFSNMFQSFNSINNAIAAVKKGTV